jgi:RNA recognition motif-containing protein
VANVNCEATIGVLKKYFEDCGTIQQVTILIHKKNHEFTYRYAFIKFTSEEAVKNAITKNNTKFMEKNLCYAEKN